MLLTESQKHYAQLIKEELGVTDQSKLNWMAQYAEIHAIHEGIQTPNAMNGAMINNNINALPLNTMGAGSPMMPYGVPAGQANGFVGANNPYTIGDTGADFHNPAYINGSGDVPMSTLSASLEIAAVTIGFDLVPVVPAGGPWAMLTFNDYPYAGGKLGRMNETVLDGKGEGAENKPIYIKLATQAIACMAKAINDKETGLNPEEFVEIKATNAGKILTGLYMGTSRIDGGIILQVVSCQDGEQNDISIAEWALMDSPAAVTIATTGEGAKTAEINKLDDGTYAIVTPELVKGVTDHIQSFSNFYGNGEGTPSNEPMDRAENETGTGNVIGARMFSKLIKMGAYEAVGTVTRQQLQDMPLYGIDVLGGVIEACQNEISQALNNRILDRVFKLGVTNYETQKAFQHVDLNLNMSTDPVELANFSNGAPYKKFFNIYNRRPENVAIAPAIVNTNAENVITHQRRIMSRMLAASNLISSVTRRGRAQWAVTNAQVLTALQDCAGFVVAPMANDLVQGGEESLYFAGTLAGMKIYVDPNMRWDDTRICVGRKATLNNNRVQGSGVVFMPYILADQVQVIAEGTMAPKVLINSRFAIVDAGWYPEQNYYTFMVDFENSTLI